MNVLPINIVNSLTSKNAIAKQNNNAYSTFYLSKVYSNQTDEISFNGKKVNEIKVKSLTDKEFNSKKAELLPKMQQFDALENIRPSSVNKANIFVLEEIVNNSDLLKNKNLTDNIGWIIEDLTKKESVSTFLEALKHPFLLDKQNFMDVINSVMFVEDKNYPSRPAKSIKSMINKLASVEQNNPELFENKNFAESIGDFVLNSDDPNAVKSMISVMDNIAKIQKENPELWENENFAKSIGNIIKNSTNNEKANTARKILKHPELWEIENFANNICNVLQEIYAYEDFLVVTESFKHPDRWNNKNFAESFEEVICKIFTAERADDLIQVLNRDDLWKNKDFNFLNYVKRLWNE